MKNLISYPDDCNIPIISIIEAKKEPRKSVLKSATSLRIIKEQCNKFQSELHNLSVMRDHANNYNQNIELKEAYIHCYEHPTIPLEILLNNITKLQSPKYGDKCQYCGINIPNTFDHYLPKSVFPELSTHPLNLFPCCGQCNTEKGSDWIDKNGNRKYINLYYDILPTTTFLFSNLYYESTSNEPSISFYLHNDGSIPIDLFLILEYHFQKLSLLTKYSKQANGEVNYYRNRLTGKTIDEIDFFLNEEVMCIRQSFGFNYWKASLVHALNESEKFKKFCANVEF
jgi:hypothetical protein